MKIDNSKKIGIIILYLTLSVLFILMIPRLLTFSPAGQTSAVSFWLTASGKKFITFIQVFVGIFLTIMFFILLSKSGILSGKDAISKYTNQGTAKEGTVTDLKGLTVSTKNAKKGTGGFTLSQNIRLSAAKSYEHVAIIGPTGSGKSTSFFIPCLLDADGTHSFVVTDPKGELHKLTSPYLKSLGMDIIKIDPLHPEKNYYVYNPILIAESQTDIREVAQLILMNGAKAIEKFKELSPDLVIMDITMPELDGIAAVKEIKKIDGDSKIIMCSAMGQQAMVIESIQSGAKDFIVKPFQADRVLEAVKKAVG